MNRLFHLLIVLSGLMLSISLFNTYEDIRNQDGDSDTTGTDPVVEEPYEILKPENIVPKKDRLFGVTISESQAGFDSAFVLAQQAGVQVAELNLPWDIIEEDRGQYVDPSGWLAATEYYGAAGIQVMLSIAVINTVKRTAPAYLSAYDYDDPEFITAFENMMDWLMTHIPQNVTILGVSIGNEVDLFLEGDSWDSYTTFYREVVGYLKNKYSLPKYGVKTTIMSGVLGNERSDIQILNQYTDVEMLNYYPQNDSFRVFEPEMVHQHLVEVVGVFRGKKIWLTEVGYQSGSKYCGSSKTMQGHFYHELFKAWDTFNQNISYIQINWLHDQPQEQIEEWKKYYSSSDPAFIEFLSTLGLRNYNNTDKPAWLQLLEETKIRGWKLDTGK